MHLKLRILYAMYAPTIWSYIESFKQFILLFHQCNAQSNGERNCAAKQILSIAMQLYWK